MSTTTTTTTSKKRETKDKSKLSSTKKINPSKPNTQKFKTVESKFLLNTSSTSFLNTSQQLDTSFNTSTIFNENEKKKEKPMRKRSNSSIYTNVSKRIKTESILDQSLNISSISTVQTKRDKKSSQDQITELFILENKLLQMEFMNQKLDKYFQTLENQATNEIFEIFQRVQEEKESKKYQNIENLNEIMKVQLPLYQQISKEMKYSVSKFNEISNEIKNMNNLIEVKNLKKSKNEDEILNKNFEEIENSLLKSFENLRNVYLNVSEFSNSFKIFSKNAKESCEEIEWIENNFNKLTLIETKEMSKKIFKNQKESNLEKFLMDEINQ
eukprot:gene1875-1016_t